jgi:hypothetical protein
MPNLEAQFEVHRRKAMLDGMNRDELRQMCEIMIDENYALKAGMQILPDLLGGMIDGTSETFSGSPDELDGWRALLSIIS